MATGLLALLDDIAALVKVTAATLDDIPAQVAKTSSKVTGVVIDDAAVTPKYVVGLDPKRELAIIYHIARRSLINKLLFLGPGVLLLGYFAPFLIAPILMLGGSYLCFEGYEKVHSMFTKAHHDEDDAVEEIETITPEELEKLRIDSAVKTDLILSAEIIAIAYATVADKALLIQAVVLFSTALAITIGVYGFVGLIVKMDDIGVYLAKKSRIAAVRAFGRGLVKGMPHLLSVLGVVGTAAMLWVGAEIVIHGIPAAHHALDHVEESLAEFGPLAWFTKVIICAFTGVALGAVIAQVLGLIEKLKKRRAR